MACENDGKIQNEHAVRCSIVSKPVYILDYIKTISSLVGASHILAVFEEQDFIKVFFDDKRCVDTLIRSCLHVLGRHVTVDYVKPPGAKLTLSNVDPVVTNYDIMRLLSPFGTVVSPVIQPPISDDIELCHISYGVRYVYVVLNGCIPDKIVFSHDDQLTSFQVSVAENPDTVTVPHIKTDNVLENPDEIESISTDQSPNSLSEPTESESLPITETADPILVSVQSLPQITYNEPVESLNHEVIDIGLVPKQSPSAENTESQVDAIVEKRRRGRPPLDKRKRLVAVAAARRFKNAKRKWLKSYTKAKYRHRTLARPRCLPLRSTTNMDMPDLIQINDLNDSDDCDTPKVLGNKDLLKFIYEVKGHRAPLECARKFIGPNCGSEKIYRFIEQLNNFKRSQNDMNLKARIWRLTKTISDALNSESENK